MNDVIDRFLSQAARRGDHPAIVGASKRITYQQLLVLVRGLAAKFAAIKQPRILIGLPQIPEAYAAILASGLVGGYHTPLNVTAPFEKLGRIAGLFQPDVIVSTAEIGAKLRSKIPNALFVDPFETSTSDQFAGDGERHRIAYVMFTSGSTGMPKGVIVPRSALNHYVNWMADVFDIQPADRLSQHPNLAFDISMTDIFGALCFGATLFPLLDEADRLMPARMIERERITVWNSVPSVVSLMMQANQVKESLLSSVRLFNFCGEPLLPEHLQAIFSVRPDVCVQNTYGPTEATIAMTSLKLSASNYKSYCKHSVAIGDPIPDMGIHLLGGIHCDEGQIVISGPQVAEGYWNEPEKTAQVFQSLPINGKPTACYFTGDWAERLEGQIFFKERMDFQVKVRGFRIELDEVAAAIRECGWPVACVFKRGETLVAVVERCDGKEFNETELRNALAKKIERHALPAKIRLIDRMPRNDNDKLDRKAATAWFEEEEIKSRARASQRDSKHE